MTPFPSDIYLIDWSHLLNETYRLRAPKNEKEHTTLFPPLNTLVAYITIITKIYIEVVSRYRDPQKSTYNVEFG